MGFWFSVIQGRFGKWRKFVKFKQNRRFEVFEVCTTEYVMYR